MIDKNSPIPIYHQLEEQLKKQIREGLLQEEEAIPSEREYAEQFQISRMTVRQAISNLVREGLLYREKGRGTFVNKQKVEQELQGLTSFTEDMQMRGMKPSSRTLSFQTLPAPGGIASRLQIAEGSPVYEISRIRLADGLPMALETNYIPEALMPGLTEEDLGHSLYEYAENRLSLSIAEAGQEIEAAGAKNREAGLLSIQEGSPILLILRTTRLSDGTPFEFVQSAYRADRYKFIHTMRRV